MKRWILITGCSSGIGLKAAQCLKERGYNVIASCRKTDDVEKLKRQGFTSILLDLASTESIDQAVESVLTLSNNQLYAVFNNGAYGQPGALEDLPTQALKEQFETNFFGWHHLTTQLIPTMRNNGEGRIVQNSSVLGFAAMKYRGAYNASKFAIEGWSDTLRLELKGTNIHVSMIEPGPIETQFRSNALLAFEKWIDAKNSVHKKAYSEQKERLNSNESNNAFALEPESCIPPLIHALEARKPKLRYRVTTPTKVFAILKRILPSRWLDKILEKAA
ncbi:SDR family oxidoreductase [uncultured Vibrio sp.]|mgnify:CR=1 FL=1|uniref:SDR family oxidoreductase n=1 Tax=uncultured Vibrio sp. TaxID=114054 RepID=UPI0009245277|nr:SDR family oxidoreductase [uncultured Vibrio sp.]OIQ25957.1 MAG: short-chain dehydrogenase [Vibrio sp. MedPE-SWchi]